MKAYCNLCKHSNKSKYTKLDLEHILINYGIDLNICKCELHKTLYETPLDYHTGYGNCMILNKNNDCKDYEINT